MPISILRRGSLELINQSMVRSRIWNNNETLGKGHLFSSAADEFQDALPPSWRFQVTAPPNSGGQVPPTHCKPHPPQLPATESGHRELAQSRAAFVPRPSEAGTSRDQPGTARPNACGDGTSGLQGGSCRSTSHPTPPSLSRPLPRCGGPSRNITTTVSIVAAGRCSFIGANGGRYRWQPLKR